LRQYIIPPRYADAYPSGSPFEYYDEPTAMEALTMAEKVIEFVKGEINIE
jgi:HEPN domain-containing protein